MKRRSLFSGFDFLQSITLNAPFFITEWTFTYAAIQIRINALTMGMVIYTWKMSHSDYNAGEYGTSALADKNGLINNQGYTITGDSPYIMPCSSWLPIGLLSFTTRQKKQKYNFGPEDGIRNK